MAEEPGAHPVGVEEAGTIGARFPCIAVTGPERSGTWIAGEMLADLTGYTTVDEEVWDNDFGVLWQILRERERIIVHAPHLTYRVHEVDLACPGRTLVVFMLRSVDDIVDSQRRNDWGARSGHSPDGGDPKGWGNPGSRWFDRVSYELFKDEIDPDAHLCVNRQRCWHRRQKHHVRHHVEIEYETLRSHPRWLEPGVRRGGGEGSKA